MVNTVLEKTISGWTVRAVLLRPVTVQALRWESERLKPVPPETCVEKKKTVQARYPEHSFVHFTMNETDDVMGFSKWKWAFTRLTQSEAHRSEEDAVLLLALQMCTVTYFADFLDPLSRKLFTD